jgi:hypothetical protein
MRTKLAEKQRHVVTDIPIFSRCRKRLLLTDGNPRTVDNKGKMSSRSDDSFMRDRGMSARYKRRHPSDTRLRKGLLCHLH